MVAPVRFATGRIARKRQPTPVNRKGEPMATQPLTHHEILTFVAPFSERGLKVDLQSSDRAARRLRFKGTRPAATSASDRSSPHETLELQCSRPHRFKLLRRLTTEDGACATVEANGSDPGALIERVGRLSPERLFVVRHGVAIARSYRIDPATAEQPAQPSLIAAECRPGGILFQLDARRGYGLPAQIELQAEPGLVLFAPQDLLAVLDWGWRPLRRFGARFRGTLKVKRREPGRTAALETAVERAAGHLSRTLKDPPAQFHPRFRLRRWRVAVQRAVPLSIGLGVLAATPLIRFVDLADDSIIKMLVFHMPPILLLAFFSFRELPRIEIPPLPRPLTQAAWIGPPPPKATRKRRRASKTATGSETGSV